MAILDTAIPSCPVESTRPYEASGPAATFAFVRPDFYGNLEYSEEAVSRYGTLLGTSYEDFFDLFHPDTGHARKERFELFCLAKALQEAYSLVSEADGLSSSQSLDGFRGRVFARLDGMRAACPITAIDETPSPSQYRECVRDLADWYQTGVSRMNTDGS
jgi:hypothetical protein